jgi:hypothetical protein
MVRKLKRTLGIEDTRAPEKRLNPNNANFEAVDEANTNTERSNEEIESETSHAAHSSSVVNDNRPHCDENSASESEQPQRLTEDDEWRKTVMAQLKDEEAKFWEGSKDYLDTQRRISKELRRTYHHWGGGGGGG